MRYSRRFKGCSVTKYRGSPGSTPYPLQFLSTEPGILASAKVFIGIPFIDLRVSILSILWGSFQCSQHPTRISSDSLILESWLEPWLRARRRKKEGDAPPLVRGLHLQSLQGSLVSLYVCTSCMFVSRVYLLFLNLHPPRRPCPSMRSRSAGVRFGSRIQHADLIRFVASVSMRWKVIHSRGSSMSRDSSPSD